MTAQAGGTPLSPYRETARQAGRRARQRLSRGFRRQAAHSAASHALQLAHQLGAPRIGVYIAYGSELDTAPLMQRLCGLVGYRTHLPVIESDGRMAFRHWSTNTPLRPGRYGIPSPVSGPKIFPAELDLILLPLVAFDAAGARLGAGAGYYDRYLARAPHHRPYICGYAFSAQEVESIPLAPWDVPLKGIVTERGFRRLSR